MKMYINKNVNKIIGLFILLQPFFCILDLIIYSITKTNIQICNLFRLIFVIYLIYLSLQSKEKSKFNKAYFLLLIYMLIYFSLHKFNLNNINSFLNVYLMPLILISIYSIKDKLNISKSLIITTTMITMIITTILKFNFNNSTINNIILENMNILALTTPILLESIIHKKNSVFKIITYSLLIIYNLIMNNLFNIYLIIINLIIIYIYKFKDTITKKEYKKNIMLLITILVTLLIFISANVRLKTYEIIKSKIKILDQTTQEYKQTELSEKFFGIKKYNKELNTNMDYFDIYYNFGFIGFVILFIIIIQIILDISKNQSNKYQQKILLLNLLFILIAAFNNSKILTSSFVSVIYPILLITLNNKRKKRLLFTAVNFEIGGIETALINLLDKINYSKYNVDVILEEKKGSLISKVNANVNLRELKVSNNKNKILRKTINFSRQLLFKIFEFHNYDFSCCYATYSLSGNKIARFASENNSIYIHSNYKYVYKTEKEVKDFFDTRKIEEFRKILIVSNEAKEIIEKLYPKITNKIEVINNFINNNEIISKSKEKINVKKPKNKKLFVFVGRLDDSSKKVSRAIEIIKEIQDTELWIIGDGPDKNKYVELVNKYNIEKNVKFYGKQINPYPYMILADYIILTSDYEGFPVTYLESIILEKQIITTIDVSDDEINIGKDFAYIISKNTNEMIKEIKKIMKSENKTKKIDFEKIQERRINKLEKIFEEVI